MVTTSEKASAARLTLCGSLSLYPVGTGAAMHLAAYAELGLAYTYVPFGVTDLAGAALGMRALGIRGLGVSMPYKQAIMPLLDAIDPVAARIGAVNTIVNDEGHLTGHNTDWIGAVRALEEAITLRGARVLLLGAGGAARAVAHGLIEQGAVVSIANRDAEKAERLARDVGASVTDHDVRGQTESFDVLLNATSVGMAGAAASDGISPVPEEGIRPGLVVMDIVYKPIETELIRAAGRRGAKTVHGGRMLLHQAARQFELYTGRAAPLDAMERALLEQISGT